MQIIELRTKAGMKFKLGRTLSDFEDRVVSIKWTDLSRSMFIVKTSEGHHWMIPEHNLDSYVEGNVEMVEELEVEYERHP